MTDNFKKYKEYITLCGGLPDDNKDNDLDKYYVIELIRRGKDNPDMPAANYHFKNYYIYSWHDLDRYEDEIKTICTSFRMRAYCSVNYKLMSQVALDTMAEMAKRIAMHDYKKPYSLFESCSAKYFDRKDSRWVIDIDDKHKLEDIQEFIHFVDSMESGHRTNVMFCMPTKSGYHLITHPFNLEMYYHEYNEYWQEKFGAIPEVQKNHVTLLYENL